MTKIEETNITTGNVSAYALLDYTPEVESLRDILDNYNPDILSGAEIKSDLPTGLYAKKGDLTISLMVIDTPYPDEELHAYCRGNLLTGDTWSHAAKTTTHVAIVVRTPAGSPPDRNAVLLVGEIALSFHPAAILWSAAKCVYPVETFLKQIEIAQTSGIWPYETMISVVEVSSSDKTVIHTRGLAEYTGHEISLPVDPEYNQEQSSRLLLSISKDLLSNGASLRGLRTTTSPDGEDTFYLRTSRLADETPAIELRTEEDTKPESSAKQPHGDAIAHPPAVRKMRARILHKKEVTRIVPAAQRSQEQRKVSKLKQDPRVTIEATLAAIRAASSNQPPEEEKPPRWMFWKH